VVVDILKRRHLKTLLTVNLANEITKLRHLKQFIVQILAAEAIKTVTA
jgi:hypothetical protein